MPGQGDEALLRADVPSVHVLTLSVMPGESAKRVLALDVAGHPLSVMAGLVPGIHVLLFSCQERGSPGQARR